MDIHKVMQSLNSITKRIEFYKVLSLIAKRDFTGPAHHLKLQGSSDSYLNENEFEFLTGLWVKNAKNKDIISYKEARALAVSVTKIMSDLHLALMPKFDANFINKSSNSHSEKTFFQSGELLKEAIFYGDAGAYEHQLTHYVKTKYSLDQEWLLEHKRLDIEQINVFASNVRDLLYQRLNAPNITKGKLTRNDFNLFLFSKKKLTKEIKSNESILNLLTLELGKGVNSKLNDIGDYNELASKPFVKLPNGKYFITSTFQVSKALYESPFYWMLSDKDYIATALANRGKIAESIVINILSTVFEKEKIFPNVLIKKSRQKTITDIDVLLQEEDTAILFQVKSKRLTTLSKKGDIESIKKDIAGAFGYAYTSQGLDAREIILHKNDQYTFENISLDRIKKINECIIVVVTLDYYPAMMAQIKSLITPFKKCHPIGISIFDLEIILYILKSKSNVIEYFKKRSKFSDKFYADNEMGMLAYHIRNGLDTPNNSDFIYVDNSMAKNIDRHIRTTIVSKLNTSSVDYQPVHPSKPGRNSPCPCGSGEKYKHCHGKAK